MPNPASSRVLWSLVVLLAVLLGGWLRLVDLGARPAHTDEAVNGLIVGELLETGRYTYDPKHYHGPLLHYLTVPIAQLRGETTTETLRLETPRLLTAVFGILTILLPLLFAPAIGLRAAALGAMAAALSPILVYYSRYSIHESIFVAVGFLFVGANWHWLRSGTVGWAVIAGVAAGLMHATKESAAITWLAAFVASIPVLWGCDIARRRAMLRRDAHTLGWGLLAALVISLTLYSSFFQNPKGGLDSIFAIFLFEPVPGHEKPWFYYFGAFAPWAKGMVGGTEWPLVLAALPAVVCLFGASDRSGATRYLGLFALVLATVYAGISYKTPWLIQGFYQVLAVLAGVGIDCLLRRGRVLAVIVSLAAVALAGWLGWTAWRVAVPLAKSDRNPYSYSATAPGVPLTARRLEAVAEKHPRLIVGAVGDYWPLPWYLRRLPKVGYWSEAADAPEAERVDVWICSQGEAEALSSKLGDGFQAEIIGLRMDTPVYLFVRGALWRDWLSTSRMK